MTENISVLSVGAHRKDPIIHSGGTLAKHVARGDKVSVLSVTHGVRTHHLRARDRIQKESGYNPNIEELIQEIENIRKKLGIKKSEFLRKALTNLINNPNND